MARAGSIASAIAMANGSGRRPKPDECSGSPDPTSRSCPDHRTNIECALSPGGPNYRMGDSAVRSPADDSIGSWATFGADGPFHREFHAPPDAACSRPTHPNGSDSWTVSATRPRRTRRKRSGCPPLGFPVPTISNCKTPHSRHAQRVSSHVRAGTHGGRGGIGGATSGPDSVSPTRGPATGFC